MVLDSPSGDYYTFDYKAGKWEPEGNVGIQNTGAGVGGVAAAIFADAYNVPDGNGGEKKVGICFAPCREDTVQRCTGQKRRALAVPLRKRQRPTGVIHWL